jgi:hypothetical protein
MLFFRFCSLAILAQFLLFSTPALAQQARPHAQTGPNPPPLSWEELGALLRESPALPPWLSGTAGTEETAPWPQATPRESAAAPEEKRFGYWGYRHRELHERRVIAELVERTKGKNCCSGINSGECRVSKVDLLRKLAYVDGRWCPMDPDTRVTPLSSLAGMHDGNEEIAVVCANRNYDPKGCLGAKTYCIGVKPPKV